METVKSVIGALGVELVVLVVGWLLYDRVSSLASFAFAALVVVAGIVMLRRRERWAKPGGIWLLLGGLMLLAVNAFVLL